MSQEQSERAQEKPMVDCRECGAPVEDARFCPACGTRASDEAAPVLKSVTCPFCGEAAAADDETCPACERRIPGSIRAAGSMQATMAGGSHRSAVWSIVGGVFILFAVIRILTALLSAGQHEALQQEAQVLAGERAYRNEQYGFSLSQPTGWERFQPESTDPNILFQVFWVGDPNAGYPIAGVAILPLGDFEKPSEAATAWQEDVEQAARRLGASKIRVESVRLDHRPAVRWEWRHDIDGQRVRELDYTVFTSKYAYQLTFASPLDGYATHKPLFMEMVRSFRVE